MTIRKFIVLVLAATCLKGGFGPEPSRGATPMILRSRSGQFVVTGLPRVVPRVPSASTNTTGRVVLEPTVVTVSLERIKEALLRELRMSDKWQGSIAVAIRPSQPGRSAVRIASEWLPRGRGYRLILPEEVDRWDFVRGTVEVLLREIANRHGGPREAEVPFWLVEGMSAHLLAGSLAGLVLEPETTLAARGTRRDALERVREILRTHPPLTWDDLSWPSAGSLTGEEAQVYRASAQLLVHELLELRGGRQAIRTMLSRLPRYLNWQLAFLEAFQAHFKSLLDVDKWWALTRTHLVGSEPLARWTRQESLRQLDEILHMTIEVRTHPDELPMKTRVTAQRVIEDLNDERKEALLQSTISRLRALQLRAPVEVAQLAAQYAAVLIEYLDPQAGRRVLRPPKAPQDASPLLRARQAVRRLDALDQLRRQLAEQPVEAVSVPSPAPAEAQTSPP